MSFRNLRNLSQQETMRVFPHDSFSGFKRKKKKEQKHPCFVFLALLFVAFPLFQKVKKVPMI